MTEYPRLLALLALLSALALPGAALADDFSFSGSGTVEFENEADQARLEGSWRKQLDGLVDSNPAAGAADPNSDPDGGRTCDVLPNCSLLFLPAVDRDGKPILGEDGDWLKNNGRYVGRFVDLARDDTTILTGVNLQVGKMFGRLNSAVADGGDMVTAIRRMVNDYWRIFENNRTALVWQYGSDVGNSMADVEASSAIRAAALHLASPEDRRTLWASYLNFAIGSDLAKLNSSVSANS